MLLKMINEKIVMVGRDLNRLVVDISFISEVFLSLVIFLPIGDLCLEKSTVASVLVNELMVSIHC